MRWMIAPALALMSTATLAGPFVPERVADDAKFVVHIDVERGKKTTVGAALLETLRDDPGYQQFEQLMMAVAGFVPDQDIRDISLYGMTYGQDPPTIIVVNVSYDRERIEAALQLAQGFEASSYNDHRLMSWIDEKQNKPMHGVLFDDSTVVLTSSQELLKKAIDVLDRQTPSLEANSPLSLAADSPAWFFLAGRDVAQSPNARENKLLSQVESLRLEVSEASQDTVAVALAVTGAEAAARNLYNMANGLKALGVVVGSQDGADEREKFLAELANASTLAHEGSKVTLTTRMPSTRVVEVIEKRALDR